MRAASMTAFRFALLASLLALAACIRVEQNLVLAPDGSGTLEIRYGMSLEDIEQMEAAASEAMAAEGEAPESVASPFSMDEEEIRREFEAYEKDGVQLDFVRTETVDGWRYAHVRVLFESLAGLGKTEFMSEKGLTLTKVGDGRYELRQIPAAPDAGLDTTGEMKDLMSEMMKGFRAVLRIEVPGDVVESNSDEAEGRRVAWIFDLDKDPDALVRVQTIEPRVVFAGEGLSMPEFRPMTDSL